MKTQLIMLDTPVIVSDEEIADVRDVKGKWHIEKGYIINQFPDYLTDLSECKLIIAGIEGLPSIDWNGLKEEFGWIDVEKIISQELGFNEYERDIRVKILNLSKRLKKVQSLSEKKFSLGDIKKAYAGGWMNRLNNEKAFKSEQDELIQSLQQPKVFEIEIEGDWNKEFYNLDKATPSKWSPKITNNSIKILRKL